MYMYMCMYVCMYVYIYIYIYIYNFLRGVAGAEQVDAPGHPGRRRCRRHLVAAGAGARRPAARSKERPRVSRPDPRSRGESAQFLVITLSHRTMLIILCIWFPFKQLLITMLMIMIRVALLV